MTVGELRRLALEAQDLGWLVLKIPPRGRGWMGRRLRLFRDAGPTCHLMQSSRDGMWVVQVKVAALLKFLDRPASRALVGK